MKRTDAVWARPSTWRGSHHDDIAEPCRLEAPSLAPETPDPGTEGRGSSDGVADVILLETDFRDLIDLNFNTCAFERNALTNMRFALYSLGVMEGLREETGIKYARAARGSLRIFRDTATLERAVVTASQRLAEGLRFRKLSAAETVGLEPALEPIADQIKGALYYEVDETGDAYQVRVVEPASRAKGAGSGTARSARETLRTGP